MEIVFTFFHKEIQRVPSQINVGLSGLKSWSDTGLTCEKMQNFAETSDLLNSTCGLY